MDLSRLKPAKGAVRERKRLGRGVGSGYGGHSATRGTKGQKARSGQKIPAYFEGGQMPLIRRVPKRGFRNPFHTEYRVINLADLNRWIVSGRLSAATPITPEVLVAAGLARKRDRIKILGDGELSSALHIRAHAFSASARAKIEAAGGTVTEIA
jgi:large subunit ribosomal protein L15